MRWWRLVVAGVLLIWVLGTAYLQAKRRGRSIGPAVTLFGAAVILFAAAILLPRPPITDALSKLFVVSSIALLALAMTVILWRGFRR